MVKISVIMPVFNGERFLKQSIDSILNQTFKDFEFIIINDGSTDGTENIILSYKDSRIVYVKNDINLKLIKSLNKGINLARGKYIARMDADDISLPQRLEEEYKFMEQHPDIGAVSCYPLIMNEEGNHFHRSRFFCYSTDISCKFITNLSVPLNHPSSFFRSEILKQFLYKDDPSVLHIEAYDLWCRFSQSGIKMAVINKYLIKYRLNSQSVCHVENQTEKHALIVQNHLKKSLGINPNFNVLLSLGYHPNYQTYKYAVQSIKLLLEIYNIFEKTIYIDKQSYKEIHMWMEKIKVDVLRRCFRNSPLKALSLIRFLSFRYLINYIYTIYHR